METTLGKITSCFGVLALLAASMIVGAVLDGLVVSVLWGYFFVPVFGLPTLPVVYAMGISLTVGFLTYQNIPYKKDDRKLSDLWIEIFSQAIGRPLLILGIGYVIHLFV